MRLVPCRASVSPRCEKGDADDDGTFDGHTIVCDWCYHRLMPYSPSGKLLLHEIPSTIAKYRKAHRDMPPVVFACLADHVFEGEQTSASDMQRRVLDADQ